MKKTLYPIVLAGLALIVLTMACNLPTTTSQPADTATLAPTIRPSETFTPVPLITPATATPDYLPFCDPNAVSIPTPSLCRLPIAEEGDSFCSKKYPYNLIFFNKGATYEVLTANFECTDAGTKDDRQMITCTGLMASNYEVRICDPACVIPTLPADNSQCPQGYGLNAAQGCCMPGAELTQQNCVTLKLRTRSCVVDCSKFTKKSTCNQNSYACIWDSKNEVCLLRQ